jgi:hypothetical protein
VPTALQTKVRELNAVLDGELLMPHQPQQQLFLWVVLRQLAQQQPALVLVF